MSLWHQIFTILMIYELLSRNFVAAIYAFFRKKSRIHKVFRFLDVCFSALGNWMYANNKWDILQVANLSLPGIGWDGSGKTSRPGAQVHSHLYFIHHPHHHHYPPPPPPHHHHPHHHHPPPPPPPHHHHHHHVIISVILLIIIIVNLLLIIILILTFISVILRFSKEKRDILMLAAAQTENRARVRH